MVKFIFAIIAFLALSTQANAQVGEAAPARPRAVDQIREAQREAQEAIQRARETGAQEAQAVRESAIQNRQRVLDDLRTNPSSSEALRGKGPIELRREESLRRLEAGKEALRTRLEAARTAAREKSEEMRAKFQEGLARIKDTRKQQIVSRLDTNLQSINTRHQERLSNLLDKIAELLSRAESRSAKAEGNGRDVTTVRAKIEAAHLAIDAARVKIADQAARTYTIVVSDEEKVRQDASATRDELKSDLKVVQDAIKVAHAAVREVLVALGQIQGVDRLEGPTSTPSETTSTTP